MRRVLLPCLLISLLLSTCTRKPELTPEETTLTTLGQIAPTFELTTTGGETFNLTEHQGKVVLINFFATWCGPCREEMPHLEKEIWGRFKDQRFAMISIGREHANPELGEFIERYELSFPVAGDPQRAVYGLYASQYIPRNIVVGPDGAIIFQSSGFDKHEFEEMIEVIASTLPKNTNGEAGGSSTPA